MRTSFPAMSCGETSLSVTRPHYCHFQLQETRRIARAICLVVVTSRGDLFTETRVALTRISVYITHKLAVRKIMEAMRTCSFFSNKFWKETTSIPNETSFVRERSRAERVTMKSSVAKHHCCKRVKQCGLNYKRCSQACRDLSCVRNAACCFAR